MKNNKKIVIFTVIFTLLLTLSLSIVFINKDSELVTKLLFNKTETNVKNSNTSPDGKASLNTYQHTSNYVKAEWAVEMVEANVFYRTGFEPAEDLPILTYNSTGNRKYGGQEFTTEDKYGGNYSLKVVDSYTNGNYTNSDLNGKISYQDYSVADFRERKNMENGTDLSVSFYAKTSGKGRIALNGIGGRADFGTPIDNYFLEDTKIDDKVIKVSNPQFFKSYVDSGRYYYLANMKGAYTNYVYVKSVNLETSEITLSGGLKGEFKAGDNILIHGHRNPVTFNSREFNSDSGWTLFNINTKVIDYADYNTLLRGFQLWINTYTKDTVYIDDLKMGYATKAQLFRDNEKLYEGLLSDYEDKAAKDKEKPNKVEKINVKGEGVNLKLNITKPDDNGTKYNYTLKTLSKTDVVESVVSTEALVNSGIKGYSYVIDKNSNTVPDNTIDTTTESTTINITTNDNYYIHVKAIDNAGNVSDVSHFTFQDNGNPDLNIVSNNNGLTDGSIMLTATATDKETLIKRIQLPNGTWVNSDVATYEVTTNGKYKFIAEDIVGNKTTKSITITNIKLKLDVTPIHKDDYINLKWSRIDGDQNYNYMVYKKEKDEKEFQSIQSNDNLKVLNIYPNGVAQNITFTTWKGETKTLPKSASLEMWMESPNAEHAKGYGMGLIDVDNVSLRDFNNSSYSYLKDSDGKLKYDVIFFGTWDCNGDCGVGGDLSSQSRDAVREYINSGKGVLFGHDTIYYGHPNMASLQSDMNIVVHNGSIAMENMGSVKVELVRKGTLTNYPWKIGDIGTVLNIPHTHISNQEVRGDVWLRFYDYTHFSGNYTNDIDTKYTNAYLTTWNNTGMIQTGHSSGAATADEQKILANTLFSLNQITEGNEWDDRSGQDIHAPNKPELLSVDLNQDKTKLNLDFNDVKDNGTTYSYYVEATGISDGEKVPSNIETATIKSELKGYSVVIDNNKDTVPDNIIETEESILNIDLEKDKDIYVHIVAVDNVGNVSDVFTYFADITAPTIDFTPSKTEVTEGPINLTIDVKDTGSGIKEIVLPDGTITTNEKTILEINENGIYKVIATDKAGNVREKEYEVKNINREPELEINLIDFTGKLKNNEIALYSEKVGKNKLILEGKAMDVDAVGVLKVDYKIINGSGLSIKHGILLDNNSTGEWQKFSNLEIPITTIAEGKYKIEVVATDSINVKKKIVLEFIVDKTSPTAELEKNNNKIIIKDAKDNLVGLLDKPYSLEYKVNNERNYKDYQKYKANNEFNLSTETSSSKYVYRGYVEDKVSNVKVTNLIEYITSVDVVEALVSEDRPNTIKIGFERQIKVDDGLKIEIKRNGNVVNYITNGNVFTDENLDYEKQYKYEITVLGNKEDGSVLKSEPVFIQLETGVPKLIVDFIDAEYDKTNDYYIIKKTVFTNLVQFNADIEYKPGGMLVVEYEDLGGKSLVERNLTSVIKNKFLFNFKANSNDIISMNMYLKNSREFTEITKTVRVKEVLPVSKDISEYDKSKYYR